MAATYTNWMREIATAADQDELSGIMARYCDSVGFAYSERMSYREAVNLAESLHKHGVAQRFKEAEHRARFLK